MHSCYCGIEIGGTKLQIAVGDDAGRLSACRHLPVDRHQGAAGIRRQIEQHLSPLLTQWQPAAVGVGFGGPVNWQTGRICRSHQIEGWSDFDMGSWLKTLTGLPVQVDNDANIGALGEAVCGAGVGCNPVFYVTLGSGVGGGLVLDGRVYHGASPGESEIGHVRLDRQGTTVESRCSGWAVDAKLRSLRETEPSSRLSRLIGDSIGGEARQLAPALQQNDHAAWRLLEETAEDLAFGLSHVTHLFHPQVIVLGGGLSLVGEPLRAAVARLLPRFVMDAFHPGPEIRLAALHERAVPVGCLVAARQCCDDARGATVNSGCPSAAGTEIVTP